jgi:hypothetical protein
MVRHPTIAESAEDDCEWIEMGECEDYVPGEGGEGDVHTPQPEDDDASNGYEILSVVDLVSPVPQRYSNRAPPASSAPIPSAIPGMGGFAQDLEAVHRRWTATTGNATTASSSAIAVNSTARGVPAHHAVQRTNPSGLLSGLVCDHAGAGPLRIAQGRAKFPGRAYVCCKICGNVVYM